MRRSTAFILLVYALLAGCKKDPFVGPYVPFFMTYQGGGDLIGRDVLLDGHNIVVCGYGTGNNGDDFFLFRLDSAGNEISRSFVGTTGNDQCWSFVKATDGGYVIAGWTDVNAPGVSNDVLMVKTDATGNQQWSKIITSPYNDQATHIIRFSDGYAMCGIKGGSADENSWILRLDASGDTLWTFTYGGNQNDGAMSICDNGDNTMSITGYTNSNGNGSTDGYIMRLNDNGEMLSYNPFGTTGYEEPHDILKLGEQWIVCGHGGTTTNVVTHDVFLQFMNSDGSPGKFFKYGGDNHDGAEAMVLHNNRICMAGRSSSSDPNQGIIYVETDIQGKELRKEWLGTPNDDPAYGLYVDDNQVLMTGYGFNSTSGRKDLLVLRK